MTSTLFYLLHYLSKSEQVEAIERDPPLFGNDLVLKQPSHHIQKHGNKSLVNSSQRLIVSLGDSDLVSQHLLCQALRCDRTIFFLQNSTQVKTKQNKKTHNGLKPASFSQGGESNHSEH